LDLGPDLDQYSFTRINLADSIGLTISPESGDEKREKLKQDVGDILINASALWTITIEFLRHAFGLTGKP